MAWRTPTTHGMANSRATMAEWERMPPVSVTTAAIWVKKGVQATHWELAQGVCPACQRPFSAGAFPLAEKVDSC